MLNAGVTREVQDGLAVLLECLPVEDLGEQVGWVRHTGNMAHGDAAGAAQLAHLEHLTIDMPRVRAVV